MVGIATINRFEAGQSKPNHRTIAALQAALEYGGAIFLDAGEMKDGGRGVRLRTDDVG